MGTTTSKADDGVVSSRTLPAVPPRAETTPKRSNRLRCPTYSSRLPATPPRYRGHWETEFVTFADTVPSPSATRVGKRISEPPPAMELMPPARKATPAAMSRSTADTSGHPTGTGCGVQTRGMSDAGLPRWEPLPDEWDRAIVVAAHPDDIEFGPAAAVAAWTAQGKDVRYVLATSGEAGISGLPPDAAGPLREDEERRAAAQGGGSDVAFLGPPDGRLVEGLELRRAVAAAIRRHQPDLVVTMHWGDTWTAADVSPASWNSADHRALGRCTLDAVADAANEWLFPELAELELEPWDGVSWTAVSTPIGATHVVDVTDVLDRAVASLAEHERYLEALSDDPVDMQAQRHVDMATAASARSGGRRVVGFALYAA